MTKEYLKMADVFSDGVESDGNFPFIRDSTGYDMAWISHAECGDRNKAAKYAAHAINSHDELVAEVERLRELEADAMRYRKLRECHWNESPICVVVNPKQMVKLGADCPTTARLDDAIDAIIA